MNLTSAEIICQLIRFQSGIEKAILHQALGCVEQALHRVLFDPSLL